MRVIRFILPFLFVRNWHTGSWEISLVRLALFGATVVLIIIAISIALYLQAPVTYSNGQ